MTVRRRSPSRRCGGHGRRKSGRTQGPPWIAPTTPDSRPTSMVHACSVVPCAPCPRWPAPPPASLPWPGLADDPRPLSQGPRPVPRSEVESGARPRESVPQTEFGCPPWVSSPPTHTHTPVRAGTPPEARGTLRASDAREKTFIHPRSTGAGGPRRSGTRGTRCHGMCAAGSTMRSSAYGRRSSGWTSAWRPCTPRPCCPCRRTARHRHGRPWRRRRRRGPRQDSRRPCLVARTTTRRRTETQPSRTK